MATTDSFLLQGIRGAIGKEIIFKRYYDKVVVSKMPNMKNRVLSAKQVETNERLKLANIYAKSQYATEEQKTATRMRLKLPPHKSLFHALVKEHLAMNKHLPLNEIGLD